MDSRGQSIFICLPIEAFPRHWSEFCYPSLGTGRMHRTVCYLDFDPMSCKCYALCNGKSWKKTYVERRNSFLYVFLCLPPLCGDWDALFRWKGDDDAAFCLAQLSCGVSAFNYTQIIPRAPMSTIIISQRRSGDSLVANGRRRFKLAWITFLRARSSIIKRRRPAKR